MEITFKDFYGQQININDETASGNLRVKVTTTENLNDLHKKNVPRIETDISLDDAAVDLMMQTLLYIKARRDDDRLA